MKTRAALALLCAASAAAADEKPPTPETLGRVDAHAHVLVEAKPVVDVLERRNVTAVNICVVDRYDPGYETVAPQHAVARRLAGTTRRLPWVATFDDSGFAEPRFAERALVEIDRALAAGARGVKVYKSLGMELRDARGVYILPDDPAFEPVFAGLAARGTTVYAHLAEPIAAWLPLDPKSPDFGYYRSYPAWHVHGRPGVPTKEAILAARDRVLERHPKLRLVGCHLGSMEEDVDEIARRFERHPGFAVDTAGRVAHLMLQPRDKVRSFFLRWADRVLYATDFAIVPGQDPVRAAERLEAEYARDWAYFASSETMDVDGRKVRGLALPEPVLRKIFRESALRWVPGILGSQPGK